MADQEINLNFKADSAEEAASQVDQLNTSLEQNAAAAEESADKGKSLTDTLSSMATGLNSAFEIGQRVYEGLKAASAEYSRQTGIINNFRGSIVESSDRINGLISNLDLMQASSRLAASGIQLADHDLANIAVAAQRYSQRTGTDLNQSFNQLTEALNSGSSEAMHRFGISTGGATDKAQGQRNAIADLNTQYGTLDASVDGASGTMTSMSVALDNATTEMITQIDSSETLKSSLSGLGGELSGLLTDLGLASGEFDIITTATDGFILGVSTVAEKIRLMISALREFSQGHYENAFNRLAESMDTLGIATRLQTGMNFQRTVEEGLRTIETVNESLTPQTTTVAPTVTAPRTGGGGGSRAAQELAPAVNETFQTREDTAASQEAYALNEQLRTEELARQRLIELSNQQILLAQQLGNEAQRAAIQEGRRIQDEMVAAEARLRITREYAETQREAEEAAQIRAAAFNTANQEMQNTINGAAQAIYQGEVSRQARKTELQKEYNQAVADGDKKKADAAKAEMKSIGSVGKTIKESLKEWLKGFAIQTGFKALAAGAEAIGLAFTNPPAAAAKGIEAAELAAVAALAGGAAAAIPKAKGGGASTPETKPSGGSSGSSGDSGSGNIQAAPIIVNISGQTYVTQAQVGEAINQALGAAKARY